MRRRNETDHSISSFNWDELNVHWSRCETQQTVASGDEELKFKKHLPMNGCGPVSIQLGEMNGLLRCARRTINGVCGKTNNIIAQTGLKSSFLLQFSWISADDLIHHNAAWRNNTNAHNYCFSAGVKRLFVNFIILISFRNVKFDQHLPFIAFHIESHSSLDNRCCITIFK